MSCKDIFAETVGDSRTAANWRPLMKLEAKDRKTPDLTCVATISEVYGDGRVKIYFDGWSNNFDYVASTSDPDLHPLGYCEHTGIGLQTPQIHPKSGALICAQHTGRILLAKGLVYSYVIQVIATQIFPGSSIWRKPSRFLFLIFFSRRFTWFNVSKVSA